MVLHVNRFFGVLVLSLAGFGLAGCGGGGVGPNPETFQIGVGLPQETVRSWTVSSIDVLVPESLSVSEDPDIRFPNVDLVWWEDEPGDRRAQIAAIMKNAAATTFSELQGSVPVKVTIMVQKFHALTPAALSEGTRGWHDVAFNIAITDAEGRVLAEETGIDADIKAYQGSASERALAQGETQKIRIARRVSQVIASWLGIV